MSDSEFKVSVVKYPDRKNLVLRWEDPDTGRIRTQSAGTHSKSKAERIAGALEKEILAGTHSTTRRITWNEFRDRCEDEHLRHKAVGTFNTTVTVFNSIERILTPGKLANLTARQISYWQTELRREGKAETSVATYSKHLSGALKWAVGQGYLRAVPEITKPAKAAKKRKKMKGRAIKREEYERMVLYAHKVVGDEHASRWKHYLEGLWWSGLRLSESLELYWEPRPGKIHVDTSGKRPMLHVPAELDKGREDRTLPMAPEFAEFLERTRESERHGRVFKLVGLKMGQEPNADWVGKIVSRIGKAAGIIVHEGKRATREKDGKQVRRLSKPHTKYASAHDLRRAFGTRWAKRVMPAVLQVLMRHESIETTMDYYVDQEAQDTADVAWQAFERDSARQDRNKRVPELTEDVSA